MLKYIIVVFLALLLTSCSPEKDSSERVQSLGNELYLNQNNKICYVNEKGGEATDFEASVSPAEITEDDFVILADGTVVPCCLDHDGDIALGNIFDSDIGDIIESERARAILNGFERSVAIEELCRKCGYAHDHFK